MNKIHKIDRVARALHALPLLGRWRVFYWGRLRTRKGYARWVARDHLVCTGEPIHPDELEEAVTELKGPPR